MRKLCFSYVCMILILINANGQNSSTGTNDPNFFPIAVWAQNPVNAAAYKSNGINMFVSIHNGLDQSKLDLLRNADMKVICHQNDFGRNNLNDQTIYGWMHGDEPDNAQRSKTPGKWDPCIDPAIIIQNYEKIKQSDPSRPVYLNVGRGVAYTNWGGRGACTGRTDMYMISNNGYLKGCDIASFDIYPVNASESDVKDSLWYVAKGIDNLLKWTENSKPAWCWIETTKISEKAERKPTVVEVKSEVWMALIHGAKGFGYFCHSFNPSVDDAALLHDSEMIRGVKAINEQVTSLAQVLNTANSSGYANVISTDKTIPVDIITKNHEGINYIFAISMRPGNIEASFTVKEGRNVEVIGENRMIKVKKGKFNDNFSDYNVHLYKITK